MTNVLPPNQEGAVAPAFWARPVVLEALGARDIGALFRCLHSIGVSQRRIARLTGLNQSDVSEIVKGRQVQSYDLLVRVADGLGIERGLMGLAYSVSGTSTQPSAPSASAPCHPLDDEDDEMERRKFLEMMSAIVVVGSEYADIDWELLAADPVETPAPSRVGEADLAQLVGLTAVLRHNDAAHGGGGCRDVILAQLRRAETLLKATVPDSLRPALLSSVADLHTLAGWTAHDIGEEREARRFLGRAVSRAKEADNPLHVAIALHHLGRVPLDNNKPKDALKLFQLGQITATRRGGIRSRHRDAEPGLLVLLRCGGAAHQRCQGLLHAGAR